MKLIEKKAMAAAIAAVAATLAAPPALAEAAADAQDAGTVVVTATMRAHTIASAPAFTTVVTEEDIARSPVNSIADLLRETVGVNNQTDGTGRDQIQIRGLDGKYTLMLVNGKRLSSNGALWRGSDFDFSSIPLNSIKRVEIVRGPMAALYGSDAIGGVVNIITKAPTQDWSGSVSAEYRAIAVGDEGEQYRLGAAVSGAFNDQFSLSVAGETYDRKPWYATSASDTTRPPRLEQKQAQNLVGTLTWKLSDAQNIDVDFGYNKDKRPLGMYFYAYYPEWNYEAKDFRAQTITRYTYGVTHKAMWNWGSTTAYVSHEDARIDDFNSRYDKPQQRVLKEDNTYAKFYANLEAGINAVTAGVDLRRQVIKDKLTYLQTGEMKTNNSALFAEDEISLGKDLKLTLAGREDHSNTFGNHFTPKTYLTWQASNEVTVKGGVNKAFKAPEAYQLSKEYSIVSCGGSCYLSGNPDLKPEKSTNYEFGAEFHRKGLNASAVLFKNDVDNLIVAVYDAAIPARKWVNVAKARTTGVELSADAELNPALSVNANFTHLNAEYTDETGAEARLENRPKNSANASLNWTINSMLQSSLSAHYTGEQFYEGKELPAYTRVDLAVSARVQKNLVLRAGVKNLTNVDLEKKSKEFATLRTGPQLLHQRHLQLLTEDSAAGFPCRAARKTSRTAEARSRPCTQPLVPPLIFSRCRSTGCLATASRPALTDFELVWRGATDEYTIAGQGQLSAVHVGTGRVPVPVRPPLPARQRRGGTHRAGGRSRRPGRPPLSCRRGGRPAPRARVRHRQPGRDRRNSVRPQPPRQPDDTAPLRDRRTVLHLRRRAGRHRGTGHRARRPQLSAARTLRAGRAAGHRQFPAQRYPQDGVVAPPGSGAGPSRRHRPHLYAAERRRIPPPSSSACRCSMARN